MSEPAPLDEAAQEARYRSWFRNLQAKRGMNPDVDPDDPEHYYDHRALYRDVSAGKVKLPPPHPGSHLPSEYKVPGHPRTYLDDTRGRIFNTETAQYLTGEPVPQRLLDASERSPDMPGFDPERAKQLTAAMTVLGRLWR